MTRINIVDSSIKEDEELRRKNFLAYILIFISLIGLASAKTLLSLINVLETKGILGGTTVEFLGIVTISHMTVQNIVWIWGLLIVILLIFGLGLIYKGGDSK